MTTVQIINLRMLGFPLTIFELLSRQLKNEKCFLLTMLVPLPKMFFIVPVERDKLIILPKDGPGWDLDILSWDSPGWDFDSRDGTEHGTEGKKRE